ncbi:MAG: hypothetical protein ABSG56_28735 [Bryobacteraceae bacterium]|jgi:RNA polymerase sigma factor (sigma-70 family)
MIEAGAGEMNGERAGVPGLLRAYLEATDARHAEAALGELVASQAEPLIGAIVRSKLGRHGAANPADFEDVCSDATVALIARLEDFRNSPEGEPLADFRAFVAVIAYRACSAHFRQVRPAFYRHRNRLRYLLESQPELAIWEDSDGGWLCGFARWRPVASRPALAPALLDDIDPCGLPASGNPASVVAEAFRRAGGPVPFDALARGMAKLWNIRDDPAPPLAESLPLASRSPSVETEMERRQWLERLWQEIGELPPRQRAALLLSLRDANGESATTLFAVTRVAGLERIAAALDINVEEFAGIWNELPWSDLQIATRLDLTRQQVINLRKCARERLSRRILGEHGNLRGAW